MTLTVFFLFQFIQMRDMPRATLEDICFSGVFHGVLRSKAQTDMLTSSHVPPSSIAQL